MESFKDGLRGRGIGSALLHVALLHVACGVEESGAVRWVLRYAARVVFSGFPLPATGEEGLPEA
jgi:hypothetical protein